MQVHTVLAYFTLTLTTLTAWIVVGGIAGWISGRIMRGGYGIIVDILLGLIGAIFVNFITGYFDLVNIEAYGFFDARHGWRTSSGNRG